MLAKPEQCLYCQLETNLGELPGVSYGWLWTVFCHLGFTLISCSDKIIAVELLQNNDVNSCSFNSKVYLEPRQISTMELSCNIFGWSSVIRSSHQRCSMKKGVFRNFGKFTGKHLCQGLFFNKAAGFLFINIFQ